MTDSASGSCVVLPCASDRLWFVPQSCLGEILTVTGEGDSPPETVEWRGEHLPVVDFGEHDAQPWRDARNAAGLVAVVLGQRGEACNHFAVALRGSNLGIHRLPDDDSVEDISEPLPDYTAAVFRLDGAVYQVPDLLGLQRDIGAGTMRAHPASPPPFPEQME